ncbi:UNVERIFIED_CONTAM: hypothetical protein ABID98_003944 [Brevibacillus sp. OAP136]|uniref:hypothetical protein n=1 Tax=Brevibacillus fluminis TaxID=511487 RepID=UPI001605B33F|nr:hypothetical protein [Brevibacillus fluminis]
MTKLLSIFACLIFTLGIIVTSMGEVNHAVVKEDGLRAKSVQWIEKAIPAK